MTDAAPPPGKVYLVGAGPGDPELLTVKAERLLHEADVVLHDALVDPAVIDGLPAGVEVVDVGKRPGPDGRRTSQAEINDRMVENARVGHTVVRLKGGDPNVFGRGGEEAEHLADAGIDFEVVPGVTSVVGAPGVVGIPLTHRSHASAVTIVTGHEAPSKDESALDWGALAETVRGGGTLVILMGVRSLPGNIDALRSEGIPADCPVAVIEKATWAEETIVTGTLETIEDAAGSANIAPPAITVVGDVVAVRDRVLPHLHRDALQGHFVDTLGTARIDDPSDPIHLQLTNPP